MLRNRITVLMLSVFLLSRTSVLFSQIDTTSLHISEGYIAKVYGGSKYDNYAYPLDFLFFFSEPKIKKSATMETLLKSGGVPLDMHKYFWNYIISEDSVDKYLGTYIGRDKYLKKKIAKGLIVTLVKVIILYNFEYMSFEDFANLSKSPDWYSQFESLPFLKDDKILVIIPEIIY
jgi:hypothetical protein